MIRFAKNYEVKYSPARTELKALLKKKSRRIKGRKSTITFVTLRGGETRYFPIPCVRTKVYVWVTKATIRYILTNFMFYF